MANAEQRINGRSNHAQGKGGGCLKWAAGSSREGAEGSVPAPH
eukprot:gene31958-20080_t